VQPCGRRNARTLGYTGKIFSRYSAAIPHSTGRARRRRFGISFSQSRELLSWKIFLNRSTIPKWVDGSRLKGNHAEASMMKMYVTKCRKRVQARKFRVDVCRGCEVKCNCLAGRHFCNNSTRTVSIVRIRRAIILVEVERNFGLFIKTISEKFTIE